MAHRVSHHAAPASNGRRGLHRQDCTWCKTTKRHPAMRLLAYTPHMRASAGALPSSSLSCSGQDFEALTPNLLARTLETVEGGGIVVLLLSTLSSLTQLYSLAMDAHTRLRTESHQQVTGARASYGVRVPT